MNVDTSNTVNKNGTKWFELKAFVSNGAGWETDVTQAGTPYISKNHFARCGYVNVFEFGKNEPIAVVPLP